MDAGGLFTSGRRKSAPPTPSEEKHDCSPIQTNNHAGNQVLVYDRADDGTLTLAETVDTGGSGGRNEGAVEDPLSSPGSLIYDADHRLVIAVNAGSNTVSVLCPDDHHHHLCLRQVLTLGRNLPGQRDRPRRSALRAQCTRDRRHHRIPDHRRKFDPIEDSTRSLELTPATGPTQTINTPAQLSFTPDGQHLVITAKGNGSLIDVFTVGTDGRPSDTFTANPAGVPIPFGFTFDDYAHLVVTDAATSTLTT